MSDGPEAIDELEKDESVQALRKYWADRLEQFEKVEYPVFYAKGYSKNTGLAVVIMDELSDALSVAAAAARGQIKT